MPMPCIAGASGGCSIRATMQAEQSGDTSPSSSQNSAAAGSLSRHSSSSNIHAEGKGSGGSRNSRSSSDVIVQVGAPYDEADSAKALALVDELKTLVRHRDATAKMGQLLVSCLVNRSSSVRETAKKLSLALKAASKKSRDSGDKDSAKNGSSSASKERDKGTVVQAVLGALHKLAQRGRQLKGSRSLGVAASLACVLLPALLMELYYNKAGRADSVHTNDNNNTQYQSNSDNSNRQQSSSSGAAPTIRAKHEKLISEVLIQLQTILLCPALVPEDTLSIVERLPAATPLSRESPGKKSARIRVNSSSSSSKVGFEDVVLFLSNAYPPMVPLLRGLFIDSAGGEEEDESAARPPEEESINSRLSLGLLKPSLQQNSLLDDCGSSQNSNNTSLTDILNEGNSIHSSGAAPRAPGKPLSGAGLDSSGTFAVPTNIPRRGVNSLLSSSSPRARVNSRTGMGVKRISVIASSGSAQLSAPAPPLTRAKPTQSRHAVPTDIFNASAKGGGNQLKRSFSSTSQSLLMEPLSAHGSKKPKRALSLSADFVLSRQAARGGGGLRPNALNSDMADDPFEGLRAGTPLRGAVRVRETPLRARQPMIPPSRSFVGETPVK